MNRTAERWMIVIGIILYGVLIAGSLLAHFVFSNSEKLKASGSFTFEENIPGVSEEQVLGFMADGALFLACLAGICVGMGILALFLLKSKSSFSAVLIIAAAALGTLGTVFIGLIGGALYLSAGIITLKKNKRQHNNPAII